MAARGQASTSHRHSGSAMICMRTVPAFPGHYPLYRAGSLSRGLGHISSGRARAGIARIAPPTDVWPLHVLHEVCELPRGRHCTRPSCGATEAAPAHAASHGTTQSLQQVWLSPLWWEPDCLCVATEAARHVAGEQGSKGFHRYSRLERLRGLEHMRHCGSASSSSVIPRSPCSTIPSRRQALVALQQVPPSPK